MINEEVVEEVLRGHLEASKWAIPRVVKVFISSTRTDFQEERKILLEQVGPEIQDMFDNTGLEVELVDMHYGTGQDVHLDPFQFDDHLHEIKRCHKVSRGCFYLCLVGEDTTPSPLPASLPAEQVTSLKERLGDDIDTLYTPDDNCSASVRSLRRPGDISDEEWNRRMATLVDQLQQLGDECPVQLRRSAVEQQLQLAAELNPDCVLGVIRVWDGSQTEPQNLKSAQKIWQCLEDTLPGDNVVRFTVPWKAEGVDPDFNEHDEYISNFQETITDKLKALINKSIEENPEINARNKPNQEVFKEALVHLAHCQKHVNATLKEVEWTGTATLEHIKHLMTSATTRHGPILVQGGHGSGKTSLINTIYVRCEEWFGKKALRVIRFAGMTPRSSYNLELLRIICSQLTLLLQPSAPCIPRDASFDPLYVNNWFQTLVRRFDVDAPDGAGHLVIILIDDLHRLNPLDSDIVAALSWLPISLPSNIHIVATTSVTPDVLKLTPVQREKFRAAECYLELPPAPEKTLESQVEKALDELTEDIGSPAMGRLSSLLTIAEFGLSETELLELLMPTSGDALELSDGFFNFSTLCSVLRKMMNRDLLREKFMSGRVLLSWKHELTSKAARKRYLLQQDTTRALHAEIANLFFSEIATQQQTQQEGTVQSHEEGKQTPFQSSLQANDVTYSLRHVEESWIHLLKSGDSSRLKQLTMCNFDFLLAAVRTVSVSYLRSILEHVRCYLLDRELELVYYTVRKSSDVLTRDTLQFGAQLICWLRSVADSSGELMARLMLSAMAWCDGYTDPLLVPLTGWLQPPLPLQIKNVIVNGGVNLIEPTPSAQHIVVVPHTGDPQLWHVMSNTLVHTFKGHSGRVLCIAMTKQSQYLLTGGEDTSIIIWDLKTFELKLRIYEHIAPVLCLTPALNNTLIASGGDDSRIIVTQLLPTGRRKAGDVVIKIDHHRGPVTNVLVTAATDILISGSSDGNVCLWALDTFTVLNTITLPSPVCRLAISSDSVFLLAACEDNQLYLHTLATGTQIHCLRGHKAKVVSIWLAGDNQRAVAGGADGRVYVFDMHSGCLVRTISTNHNSKVSGVKVTANDDFLITAGGNRITFWSFRKEDGVGIDELGVQMSGKPPNQAQRPHTASISCLDISRDGTTVVTGAMDSLINVWLLNTHELSATLEGHLANVTCLAISPNGLFVISGSEDKTARVWGLTLGLVVSVFTGHQATVTAVGVLSDSRRVVSSDRQGVLAVWVADNGTLLHTALGPTDFLAITNNMKYAVSGNGDNSLRIWPLTTHRDDERFIVSHKEEVTCFVLTADSLHVITGSRDMSLKVWQVVGGKLTQVLVGHTDQVTCVAVAVTNKSIVVSGSRDANLIVWDMDTGDDLHLLTGHLGYVTCVKLSADGTLAISGSEDKRIIAWDTKQGVPLSTLQLHLPILGVVMSTDVTRVAVHLLDSKHLPIVCLHNTPATYVKIPIYVAPAKEIEDLRPSGPKRPMKRLLKKEVSLDTYTWQKKYGHLTSSIMMTQVDERMRRRFSVSASMEEISKIPANKDLGSQCTGPEHAALVQSQHFDQLEALWNKKSPPRSRRTFQSLSKQNSRSSRRDSSENDDCPSPLEEVAGEISDLSSGD